MPSAISRPPPALDRFEIVCVLDALPHALKLLTLEDHLPHAAKGVASLSDALPQALKPLALKDHLHMPRNLSRHCKPMCHNMRCKKLLKDFR